MYHPSTLLNMLQRAFVVGLIVQQIFLCAASKALELSGEDKPVASHRFSIRASVYPPAPQHHSCREKPSGIDIYECDQTPLGDRMPFLLVHGLRGEYYQGFRWERVIQHFRKNEGFSKRFKLYLVRYDSLAPLDVTVPLMRGALANLYEAGHERPISIMALSIGGNLAYEAMLDHQTDTKVKLLMTLGTPFHGSPLFSANWFQYGIYKSLPMPWTRLDRAIAYRLYFQRNASLLKDYSWDDSDQAIPNIGHFSSYLPFGPRGDLTVDGSLNKRLLSLADRNFDKKKLVTYAGYLLNPYLKPKPERFIETRLLAPLTLFSIEVPAHLAREHAVLKMLNRQMTVVVTNAPTVRRAKTSYVYALNDGITPLASALFLAPKVCMTQSFASESDIARIKAMTDVGTARIFRNIDHLTFIDGSRSKFDTPKTLVDELNPEAQKRDIFSWMLADIAQSNDESSRIAKESTPGAASEN